MIYALNALTIDCANPRKLAKFWAETFGTQVVADYDYYVSISTPEGAPSLAFRRVPEAQVSKSRIQMDIGTDQRDLEVTRLMELGASRISDHQTEGVRMSWTVMADPEGNEFCVSDNFASASVAPDHLPESHGEFTFQAA